LEKTRPAITAYKETVKENKGFVFGSYGVDEDGQLVVMLNGIYAVGVGNKVQVGTVLSGIEKIFAGLPVKKIIIASQYGGTVEMPDEYSSEPIVVTRLRALDDGNGKPETVIYDDLQTGKDLNKPHSYGKSVWHKIIK